MVSCCARNIIGGKHASRWFLHQVVERYSEWIAQLIWGLVGPKLATIRDS